MTLDKLAADARRGAPVLEEMAAALELFRRFADAAHHGKEEQLLFPALARAGLPSDAGPLAVMQREHELGRGLVRRISAGLAARDGRALAAATTELVEHLRHHIAKENHVLFPMARRLLGSSGVLALADGCRVVELRELGPAGAAGARAEVVRLAGKVLGSAVPSG